MPASPARTISCLVSLFGNGTDGRTILTLPGMTV